MFLEVIKHTFMITGFVFVMMLVIEYINVQTKGGWHLFLQKSKWLQYLLAAALGSIPGCLGAFTVVTLFSHNILSLGALVATMIATSGDEAFIMLAMFPDKAILIFILTFFIGIIGGMLTDLIFPNVKFVKKFQSRKLPLHEEQKCDCFPKNFLQHLKKISLQRALLIVIISLLLLGFLSGEIAHDAKNWIRYTIIITSVIALFIVITVPDHFMKEHLWNHIVKVHIPKIFLWTFAALLVINLLLKHWDINQIIASNKYYVLLIAALIGLIPESGPHFIFVTLFAQGSIPFSILLTSSIVQDGHGMIPLLAETKRGFFFVKLINLIIGLIIGYSLLLSGW